MSLILVNTVCGRYRGLVIESLVCLLPGLATGWPGDLLPAHRRHGLTLLPGAGARDRGGPGGGGGRGKSLQFWLDDLLDGEEWVVNLGQSDGRRVCRALGQEPRVYDRLSAGADKYDAAANFLSKYLTN